MQLLDQLDAFALRTQLPSPFLLLKAMLDRNERAEACGLR